MRRWLSRPLVLACGLLALVAVLAVLQYRWLGEVSEAERERVRAHLQQLAADVQREFDREITRAFVTFQITPDHLEADPAGAMAASYRAWQGAAVTPAIVHDLYLARAVSGELVSLQRFDATASTLSDAPWPAPLVAWRDRSMRAAAKIPGGPPLLPLDPIASDVPALIIGVPHLKRVGDTGHQAFITDIAGPSSIVIATLDPDRLRDDLITPLLARYFGADPAGSYLVSIGSRDDRSVVYASTADRRAVPLRDADVVVSLFDLQPADFNRVHPASAPGQERVAITIVRRADAGDTTRALIPGAPGSGAWQLRVRHRNGSLEQIVASSRRRNLAISSAILAVLAGGIVLIVTYTERRQRLARQQMEFVAAVSHELRTPLAVICSAADNLADGVVTDAAQAARYGALVRTEGRRLTDMVERVLAFAGINTHQRTIAPRVRCELGSLVEEAIASVRAEAEARQNAIRLNGARNLVVIGDPAALRSALQNVLGNAVKYSRPGDDIEVALAEAGGSARIRVTDRGLGIDAGDLPHVWQPFYRGRRARDAQIRGTGIGLSIVGRVVADHGGTVAITSDPDAGTTVTVELPLAPAAEASVGVERATA